MNGPAGHKEKEEPSDDSMSEDEFIAKLLRESIGEEEDEDMPPAADDVVETEDAEEEPEDSEDENFDFDEDEEEEESSESLSEEEELEQFIDSIQPRIREIHLTLCQERNHSPMMRRSCLHIL